jgi:hypothetical protein
MFGVGNVPPEGYQYPHPIWGSPHPTMLKSKDREGIINEIKRFRIDAGLPVGNPELDYDEYAQRLQDVRDGKLPAIDAYPIPKKPIPRTLADRIAQWVSNRYGKTQGKINYVEKDEADRRAKNCVGCVHNKEWEQYESCAPCLDNTKRGLLILSKGNETSVHRDLHGCEFYGHSNKEAVWLPEELLRHRNREELKDGPNVPCWLKDLDK